LRACLSGVWSPPSSGPTGASPSSIDFDRPSPPELAGSQRASHTIGDFRASLARGSALPDLSRVVSVGHRHDVLGLPKRQSRRSARPVACVGSRDGRPFTGAGGREVGRAAVAGPTAPQYV